MRPNVFPAIARLGVVVSLGAGCAVADAANSRSADTTSSDPPVTVMTSSDAGQATASIQTAPTASVALPVETVEFGVIPDMVLVSDEGQVVVLRDGVMTEPVTGIVAGDDETLVAATLEESTEPGPATTLTWTNLANGLQTGRVSLSGDLSVVATDQSGRFVALTSASPTNSGAIGTEIVIADADGERFRQRYDTEIVPEGFSNTIGDNGLPIGLFIQEFLDPPMSDTAAPRWYQVRVLDTATGELQLPFNLRDKATLVDEQMLGFSRSHVLSLHNGLLFTLYRGVSDDASNYAFVHTLGFASGVWCLELPDQLSLEWELGALGLVDGESKLLVVSANGFISEFVIADITTLDGTESVPSARRTVRAWQADTSPDGPSVATAPGVVVVGQGSTVRWIDPTSLLEISSLDFDIDIEIESLAVLESGDAIVAGAHRLLQVSPTGELTAEGSIAGFGAVARILLL